MAGKRLTHKVIVEAWNKYVHPKVRESMTFEEIDRSFSDFTGPYRAGWQARAKATKPAAKRAKRRSK